MEIKLKGCKMRRNKMRGINGREGRKMGNKTAENTLNGNKMRGK